jgi:hypothetical protein
MLGGVADAVSDMVRECIEGRVNQAACSKLRLQLNLASSLAVGVKPVATILMTRKIKQ